MSDKVKGLIVAFEDDFTEERANSIALCISNIRGVLTVQHSSANIAAVFAIAVAVGLAAGKWVTR